MFVPSLAEEVDLVAEDEADMVEVDTPAAEVDVATWAAVAEEVVEDSGEGEEDLEDAAVDAKYKIQSLSMRQIVSSVWYSGSVSITLTLRDFMNRISNMVAFGVVLKWTSFLRNLISPSDWKSSSSDVCTAQIIYREVELTRRLHPSTIFPRHHNSF